jgi:hypothetical protein
LLSFRRNKYFWSILCLLYMGLSALVNAEVLPATIGEVSVIGTAVFGTDPDYMYKAALQDAFRKAYDKIRPAGGKNAAEDERILAAKNDLIQLQTELGITEYQVLRYWKEQNRFFIELKVTFGDSQNQSPRLSNLSRLPKVDWVYETKDQILTLSKNISSINVSTTQNIEVLGVEEGNRIRQFNTGVNPHAVSGDKYLIQDDSDLKLGNLNQPSFLNLFYVWRKKLPDLIRVYLSNDTAYAIEKNGLIRAFTVKDDTGGEKWELQTNSQTELKQITYNRLLVTLSTWEIWVVNTSGEKLWVKKFDQKLMTGPVADGGELFCLFENGELKILDLDSGRIISTWNIETHKNPRNVALEIDQKKLFLLYNDELNHGCLQVYHRFSGDLLWEVFWDQAVSGLLTNALNAVLVGVGNTLEARENWFGMKLWEEPVNGRITKLYRVEGRLFIVSGNRLYGYTIQ